MTKPPAFDEGGAVPGEEPASADSGPVEALPVDLVPRLTSGSVEVDFPDKATGRGLGLGLGLSGTEAGKVWGVRVASAVRAAGRRVTVLTASVAPEVGLRDLPLVGVRLPEKLGEVTGLTVVVRSPATDKDLQECQGELERLLMAADSAGVPRPDPDFRQLAGATFLLGLEISLDPGNPTRLWVNSRAATRNDADLLRPPVSGADDGLGGASVGARGSDAGIAGADEAVGGDGGVQAQAWYALDKALGPVRIKRVGLSYAGGPPSVVGVLLDASLEAGGVVLDTTGLGVTVSWDKGVFHVEGRLDGLGLAYTAGPVTLGGALARDPSPPPGVRLLIGGLVLVATPAIGFSAAGMYAELTAGGVSMLVIARLTGLRVPLGPVVLTGLVVGLGYNSRLALPSSPSDVPSHPLLDRSLPVDQGPVEVVRALGGKITPQPGTVWLAAGADFEIFKLVQATAVIALQVSPDDVTVALLAEADVRFPKNGTAYARSVLGLVALFRSSTGEITVHGALNPSRSYVVHPDCRLQGGFALCTWIRPSPHSGDFVISLGGYHPAYRRPDHYPEVRRLGLHWSAGQVDLVGECYAAATPSMLMLGGRLEVSYHSGRVSAWLEAWLDVVAQWEPLWFTLSLGVRVSAEIQFLGTHHVELGATLNVWGPPTGGTATVHLPLVPDITVRFGDNGSGDDRALTWDQFDDRILGRRQPQVQAVAGFRPVPGADPKQGERDLWVDPNGFRLSVTTPLPCSSLLLAKDTTGRVPLGPARQVHIRPMHRASVDTTCTVTLLYHSGEGPDQVIDTTGTGGWVNTPIVQKVPAGAFGAPSPGRQSAAAGEESLEAVLGVEMASPAPTDVGALEAMDKRVLDAEGSARGTVPAPHTALGPAPTPGTRDDVRRSLSATAAARAALLAEWERYGYEPDAAWACTSDPTALHRRLWSFTTADPLLV